MKTLKPILYSTVLVILILGTLFGSGCAPKTMAQTEDIVNLVQEGRLPRTDLDDISYDVREFIEKNTRGSFVVDMWSYTDALGYWVNAEMIDMCGTAEVEYSLEPTPTATGATAPSPAKILKMNVLIIYESYVESLDQMQYQWVYAELIFKNGEWTIKQVAQEKDANAASRIAPEGMTLRWINNSNPLHYLPME